MSKLETFLVELHVALDSADEWSLLESMLDAAIDRARSHGTSIRLMRSSYLPLRTALLCLLEAPSEATLRDVLHAATLPVHRVEPVTDPANLDPHEARR